jgi:hypothetical protein
MTTEYLTVHETAELLRLSTYRVRQLARAGRFPGAVKPNDNQQARWLIPRTGIDNYLGGTP